MRKWLAIAFLLGVVGGAGLTVAVKKLVKDLTPPVRSGEQNLTLIGIAAWEYARHQSDGAMPDSFRALLDSSPEIKLTPRVFFDPQGPNAPSAEFAAHIFDRVDTDSDFVWIGKGKRLLDRDAIIAYEKPEAIYNFGVRVLYPDMDTECLSISEARKLIPGLAGARAKATSD